MPRTSFNAIGSALTGRFAARIDECLAARHAAQARIDEGTFPSFPPDRREFREADWRVAAADAGPPDADAHAVGDAMSPAGLAEAGTALAGGTTYVELANLQTRDEARLWHDVLDFAAEHRAAASGAVHVRVLVDTVQAAFELEEMLYELRDYAVALAWHRNRYLLSFIRTFHRHPQLLLPDRSELEIGAPFLRALGKHATRIGERRGLAVAGFPVPSPDSVNPVEPGDLSQISKGKITEEGIRDNLEILFAYLPARDAGRTTATVHGEEHDAASADLALAQLRQWTHHPTGVLDLGYKVDLARIGGLIREEEHGETADRVLSLIAEAKA